MIIAVKKLIKSVNPICQVKVAEVGEGNRNKVRSPVNPNKIRKNGGEAQVTGLVYRFCIPMDETGPNVSMTLGCCSLRPSILPETRGKREELTCLQWISDGPDESMPPIPSRAGPWVVYCTH